MQTWTQNKRMRTSYVPVMHCEKMAVTDMSFRQCAVIEFLVKEGNCLVCMEMSAWVPEAEHSTLGR
jgi:hypothetical protein